ncbi:hypothetical protein M5689_022296 [Euphorbia peplus]|nr:hypothetical protein M5689_022296 [Euphorbia peplus]
MVIKYFLIFSLIITIFLSDSISCLNKDTCKESTCGHHGPAIRFPFRIIGRQPDHCGFPDVRFHLSCSDKKETILELQNSVKLLVTAINYKSQLISTTDPQGCLPKQLRHVNLSDSPFRYPSRGLPRVLFNCTRRREDYEHFQIGCSSNPTDYQVYSADSGDSIGNPSLLYCTKMFDVDPYPSGLRGGSHVLGLRWSNPSCGSCAARNRFCRLKPNNVTKLPHTECYGNVNHFNCRVIRVSTYCPCQKLSVLHERRL